MFTTDSGKTCAFDLRKQTVYKPGDPFSNFPSCDFQWVTEMWFENTPSAVTVTLQAFTFRRWKEGWTQQNNCVDASWGEMPQWRLIVKTMGSSSKTERFTLDDIIGTNVDAVVVPGVRMISKYRDVDKSPPGALNYMFACFHIDPSE